MRSWLGLTLAFEWRGCVLILGRPVDDILAGWHIGDGYMWPYVLLAYVSANLTAGLTLRPGKTATAQPAAREAGALRGAGGGRHAASMPRAAGYAVL